MSTNPEAILPSWTSRAVVTFNGAHDTHIETGELYGTITLAEIFEMEPAARDKLQAPAILPSTYDAHDARSHAVQREHGRFVALVADIDHGDVGASVILAAVKAFAPGCAHLIYSSASSKADDKRWRVILPLAEATEFGTWYDAQTAFFAFLASQGIEADKALARAGQPVYLPNVPPEKRRDDGAPLFYRRTATKLTLPGLDLAQGEIAAGIAALRLKRADDERERERIRKEAEQRRAARPRGDNASIIDDFNAANSVATMLELCGYEQSPVNAEDWRSPHQTGQTYATRIIGSKWVSLSESDTAAGLGSKHGAGCYGDAYDLYVHFKHGGDHKAAYRTLGAEMRGANVVPFPTPEVPAWMRDIPPPEEPLEYEVEPEQAYDELGSPIEPANDDLPALPFFWFDEAAPNLEANDFVEGLLTSGTMSVIYGQSNCGKTFFVVDMALHVAMGREWRGRAVDKGAIVYLSLEGSQGIRNRLAAFRKHHGVDERLPFVAMPKPIDLLKSEADVAAVIALVHHVAHETGLPVAMVIVDTLSRAMAGGNENSPEDMTALIGNCDRIRHATQAHVCIVHHSGKDDAKGARGHSSLRAATDTEIEIKRDPELTYSSVRVAKQRDLEAGEPFGFTLQSVALGTNRRGKDVTSCVVVESDQTVVLARDPEKLSPKETAALESLERCLEAGGFEIDLGRNMGVTQAVTLPAWKRSLQGYGVIERNNDDMARPQFHRIKKGLERKGQIQVEGGNVWLA